MTQLYLYDDARARTFAPFILTRPVSELTSGATLMRERWERVTHCSATGFISAPHLADFEEFNAPPCVSNDDTLPAGAILVNARCAIALNERLDPNDSVWRCEDLVCAVRLSTPLPVAKLTDGTLTLDDLANEITQSSESARLVHGRWITEVWDYIAQLSLQLADDIQALIPTTETSSLMYDSIGEHPLIVEEGATVEPYVLFDTTAGPILIRKGATISAFTRLVGPCYVDSGSTILGEMVATCSIGPMSKIRGEIQSSIVLGYSNKGHAGFVGHSYLGRWVNLGAGTTTSNLKNTYGTVQLWTPEGLRNTNQQFLGTLFGDHAKTGIGTMLNTGTVLSVGANVYGSLLPPKYVPPFAWGDKEPYKTFEIEKFLQVVERVMKRRKVELSDKQRRQLRGIAG
jgi:UDP-N-acetylglucosamine diphosphorylase/glucosamine-1-phosphate N-acetyltransferase